MTMPLSQVDSESDKEQKRALEYLSPWQPARRGDDMIVGRVGVGDGAIHLPSIYNSSLILPLPIFTFLFLPLYKKPGIVQ